MLIRYFRDSFLRDADDGGGGGGGGEGAGTPAGGGGTPQGGGGQQQPRSNEGGGGGGGGRESPAELAQRLRSEAAAQRVARQQAQEQLATAQAQLETARADTSRLVAEEAAKHAPTIKRLQGTLINAELKAEAVGMGLTDMDMLALPALDRSKIVIKDDGTVDGVKEALTAFKAAKPGLFATQQSTVTGSTQTGAGGSTVVGGGSQRPTATGSGANPPAAGAGGPVSVKDMSADEYKTFKAGMRRRLGGR